MNNFWNGLNREGQLSKQDFYLLCQKAQAGDQSAREKIILANYRYVESIVKTFIKRKPFYNYLKDDIYSVALIGLNNAIDGFDLTKDFAFLTYADPCIKSEINRFIRKEMKYVNQKSTEATILEDSDITLLDTISDSTVNIETDYEKENLLQIIRNLSNFLDDNDRKIITYFYGFKNIKLTQEEIAKILRQSQTTISRKIAHFNQYLKEIILNKDNEIILQKQYESLKLNSKITEFLQKLTLEDLIQLNPKNPFNLQIVTSSREKEIRLTQNLRECLGSKIEIDEEMINQEIFYRLNQIFNKLFIQLSEREQYVLLFYYRLVRIKFISLQEGNISDAELNDAKNKLNSLFSEFLKEKNIKELDIETLLPKISILELNFSNNPEEDFFIKEYLEKLSPEKKKILILVYGLVDGKKCQYSSICELLNVTTNVIYNTIKNLEQEINNKLSKIKEINLALNNQTEFLKFSNSKYRYSKILNAKDSKRLKYIIELLQKMPQERRQLFVLYFGLKDNNRTMQSELINLLHLERKQIESILTEFYKKVNRNLKKQAEDLSFDSKEEMQSLILNNCNYQDILVDEDLKIYKIVVDTLISFSQFYKVFLYYFGINVIRKLNISEIAQALNLNPQEIEVIINKFISKCLKKIQKELKIEWTEEELKRFIEQNGELNMFFDFKTILTDYILQENQKPLLKIILPKNLNAEEVQNEYKISAQSLDEINDIITKRLNKLQNLKDRVEPMNFFAKYDIEILLTNYNNKRQQAIETISKTLTDRNLQLFNLYYLSENKMNKTTIAKMLGLDASYITKKINDFEDLIYQQIFNTNISREEFLKLLIGKCIFELKNEYQKVVLYYYKNPKEPKLKQADLAEKLGIKRVKVTKIMQDFEDKFRKLLSIVENNEPQDTFSFDNVKFYYRLSTDNSYSNYLRTEIRIIIHGLKEKHKQLMVLRNYKYKSSRPEFSEFSQTLGISLGTIYKMYDLILQRINVLLETKGLAFNTIRDLDNYIWSNEIIDQTYFIEEEMIEKDIDFETYKKLFSISNSHLAALDFISQKIIALAMGYADGFKYSTSKIAEFLNLPLENVRAIINEYLLEHSDNMSNRASLIK